MIPRFTACRTAAEERGIAALYSDLAEDERRNLLFVRDVKQALKQGRSPILLTERREHVQRLAALLSEACPSVITLYGTTSAKLRREAMERLQSVSPGEPLVVVATGKYVGEGFDCPRLDTLLLTLPVAWKGIVAQHRSYPGKEEVQVYDYVDVHVPMLETMYQKRLKAYAAIGYHIKADAETPLTKDLIYDGKSFYPVFCQDLRNAEKEILIVSPFMTKSRLRSWQRCSQNRSCGASRSRLSSAQQRICRSRTGKAYRTTRNTCGITAFRWCSGPAFIKSSR